MYNDGVRNPKVQVQRNARRLLVLGRNGHWTKMCPNCGRGLTATDTMGANYMCLMCGAYWFIQCMAHDPTVDDEQQELKAWQQMREAWQREREAERK